ncbi:hypothetical protein MHYP_G00319460 [Metynnis hypsauchen]
MRAHELHSVLSPGYPDQPSEQGKSKPVIDKFCFNCSLPGFTSCTCPNCRGVPSTSKHTDPAAGNAQREMEDESNCLDYGITDHGVQRKGSRQTGILPDLGNIQAVTDFKTPSSVKQVRQFLGLTSYYRRFIHDYAHHAESLFALTKHVSSFVWDEKCEAAVKILKSCLTSAPILKFPDFGHPFSIHTDSSDAGLGAALMQKNYETQDVAVAYASCTLPKAAKPYSTPEKECLAVIWALEYFKPYFESLHVIIFSDHRSLRWLMSRPNPSGRLARWSLSLQDFDFSVVHKPRAKNKVPVALSRNPQPSVGATMDILPDFAIIGSLDFCALPPVMPTDREHLRQLQLDDPVTGKLLSDVENVASDEIERDKTHKYTVQDGLLYYSDSKASCVLHPMKQLNIFAPLSLRTALLRYYKGHLTAGHLGATRRWPVSTQIFLAQNAWGCQRICGLLHNVRSQNPVRGNLLDL